MTDPTPPREIWDRRRQGSVEDRLEALAREVHETHVEARMAHEEARGAHAQALRTNGRVSDLEAREKLHLAEAQRLAKAVFGRDDGSLDDDGGLYGYVRAQRRDTRLLAAWAVAGLPVVMFVIQRMFG